MNRQEKRQMLRQHRRLLVCGLVFCLFIFFSGVYIVHQRMMETLALSPEQDPLSYHNVGQSLRHALQALIQRAWLPFWDAVRSGFRRI